MSGNYGLEHETIAKFEAQIEEWYDKLPQMLPNLADRQMLRSQMILRLQHAAVQISLYRPFLNYICPDGRSQDFNYQGYAYGSSCLRASTQVIVAVDSMEKEGLLHESQW